MTIGGCSINGYWWLSYILKLRWCLSICPSVRPGADLGFRTSTYGQDQVLKSRSLDGRGGRQWQMAATTILSRCDQRSLLASLLVVNFWWWGIYIFIDKCSDVDHIINSSLVSSHINLCNFVSGHWDAGWRKSKRVSRNWWPSKSNKDSLLYNSDFSQL
jgi:hypothetical protein